MSSSTIVGCIGIMSLNVLVRKAVSVGSAFEVLTNLLTDVTDEDAEEQDNIEDIDEFGWRIFVGTADTLDAVVVSVDVLGTTLSRIASASKGQIPININHSFSSIRDIQRFLPARANEETILVREKAALSINSFFSI
jgi:hypothetical protein